MSLLPSILEVVRVAVAILIADLLLDRYHRVTRRRRMRELNRLSQEARARRRAELGK